MMFWDNLFDDFNLGKNLNEVSLAKELANISMRIAECATAEKTFKDAAIHWEDLIMVFTLFVKANYYKLRDVALVAKRFFHHFSSLGIFTMCDSVQFCIIDGVLDEKCVENSDNIYCTNQYRVAQLRQKAIDLFDQILDSVRAKRHKKLSFSNSSLFFSGLQNICSDVQFKI